MSEMICALKKNGSSGGTSEITETKSITATSANGSWVNISLANEIKGIKSVSIVDPKYCYILGEISSSGNTLSLFISKGAAATNQTRDATITYFA